MEHTKGGGGQNRHGRDTAGALAYLVLILSLGGILLSAIGQL